MTTKPHVHIDKTYRILTARDPDDAPIYTVHGYDNMRDFLLDVSPNTPSVSFATDEWTYGGIKPFTTRSETMFGLREAHIYPGVLEAMSRLREKHPNVEIEAQCLGRTNLRKRRMGDDGDDIDIQRWQNGDPDYWVRTARNRKSRTVRLGIQCCLAGIRPIEDYINMTATALLISEILNQMGMGTEIIGFFTGYHPKFGDVGPVVTLKSAEQLPDLGRLASFAYPGLGRDLMLTYLKDYFGLTQPFRDCTQAPSAELLDSYQIAGFISNRLAYSDVPSWLIDAKV